MHTILDFIAHGNPMYKTLAFFLIAGLIVTVFQSFFKACKIQPKGFKWKQFRNEIIFAAINMALSGWFIKTGIDFAVHHRTFLEGTPTWWMSGLEYAAYFVLFDTWFYWLHRLMHKEPIYFWVHKLHHLSTSTNVVANFSVNPLESLINGGFVPLFILLMPIHKETMAYITPTNVLMGVYIHSGYEFLPRWWNKSWATKWFITATFHDQHHKYFNYNFGGYTTVWDRICGTMRKKYEADFELVAGGRRSVMQTMPEAVPAE
jgi:sterol desaturase/sphingolipid hydroxylase (fatty acid hydroxylase superfamily)